MTRYYAQVDSNYYEIDIENGNISEIIKSERRNGISYICESNLVAVCDKIQTKENSK